MNYKSAIDFLKISTRMKPFNLLLKIACAGKK